MSAFWLGVLGVALLSLLAAPPAVAAPAWLAPESLSPGSGISNLPQVATGLGGAATAVWQGQDGAHFVIRAASRPAGGHSVVQADAYDQAGPQLGGLSIPAHGRAGVPVTFAVSPLDIWSGLGGITWSFGDRVASTGTGAKHAYARAGTYKATITAADSLGNQTTAAATIAIVAGRAYAARLAEVRGVGRG